MQKHSILTCFATHIPILQHTQQNKHTKTKRTENKTKKKNTYHQSYWYQKDGIRQGVFVVVAVVAIQFICVILCFFF